jgi:hypothetical protein
VRILSAPGQSNSLSVGSYLCRKLKYSSPSRQLLQAMVPPLTRPES